LLAYIQSLGRPRQLAGYDSPPKPSSAPNLQEGTDPALIERGSLPGMSGSGAMVIAVLAAGLLSSIVATRAALGSPLLDALRSE